MTAFYGNIRAMSISVLYYIEFVMFSRILVIVNPCLIKLIHLDTMGMYRAYILCYNNIKAHSSN